MTQFILSENFIEHLIFETFPIKDDFNPTQLKSANLVSVVEKTSTWSSSPSPSWATKNKKPRTKNRQQNCSEDPSRTSSDLAAKQNQKKKSLISIKIPLNRTYILLRIPWNSSTKTFCRTNKQMTCRLRLMTESKLSQPTKITKVLNNTFDIYHEIFQPQRLTTAMNFNAYVLSQSKACFWPNIRKKIATFHKNNPISWSVNKKFEIN